MNMRDLMNIVHTRQPLTESEDWPKIIQQSVEKANLGHRQREVWQLAQRAQAAAIELAGFVKQYAYTIMDSICDTIEGHGYQQRLAVVRQTAAANPTASASLNDLISVLGQIDKVVRSA